MSSSRLIRELSSPPGSDLGEEAGWDAPQAGTVNTNQEIKGEETPAPKADNARAPRRPKLTGIAADEEKALRQITNHQRYNNFLEEADMRRMKRQDLAARNKIWEESRDQAWARINVIDQEKKKLLEQINAMHAAKQAYNAGNAVAVSEESDVETKRKWEAFFNLETNVLDV